MTILVFIAALYLYCFLLLALIQGPADPIYACNLWNRLCLLRPRPPAQWSWQHACHSPHALCMWLKILFPKELCSLYSRQLLPQGLPFGQMDRSHVALDVQHAYREYVRDAQRAYDEQRGFSPIDRILFNQPLAMRVRDLVTKDVPLSGEDKHALVCYHYSKHEINLTELKNTMIAWFVSAGLEHRAIISSLDNRPTNIKISHEHRAPDVPSHRGAGTTARSAPPSIPGRPPPTSSLTFPQGEWEQRIDEIESIEHNLTMLPFHDTPAQLPSPAPPDDAEARSVILQRERQQWHQQRRCPFHQLPRRSTPPPW